MGIICGKTSKVPSLDNEVLPPSSHSLPFLLRHFVLVLFILFAIPTSIMLLLIMCCPLVVVMLDISEPSTSFSASAVVVRILSNAIAS